MKKMQVSATADRQQTYKYCMLNNTLVVDSWLAVKKVYRPDGRNDRPASSIFLRNVSVQISPPSWIFKIWNFWRLTATVVRFCVFVQNFARIGQTAVEL